ncbi:MAG: rod shape-determining protein MreC [Rickettsiales bacterium]|jgi:rod shape-determining protein MreC|nr:rod shape-determining protein MreC [Rickettsiales bacterium]
MRPIYKKKKGIVGFYWVVGYRIHLVVNKISYGLLVILSVLLMLYGRVNRSFEDRLRTLVFYQLKPFLFVTRSISMILDECGTRLVSIWSLDRRNKELIKENFNLRLKLFEFDMIESENNDLRKLLSFVSKNRIGGYAIKKINVLNTHGITHSVRIFLNETEVNSVSEHDLVLDRYGNLIGRVVNVSKDVAEILLVSDYRSRVPANLETSKLKVIVGGNGSDLLDMEYFFNNGRDALLDENVYTSNDGDLLQEGIAIGKVIKTGKKFSVKLNSDLNLLDLVIVIYRKPRQLAP